MIAINRISWRRAAAWLMLITGLALLPVMAWVAWRNLRLTNDLSSARRFSAAGDFSNAVSILQQVSKSRASHPQVRFQLGVALRRAGRLEDADRTLREARSLGYAEAPLELQRCLLTAQAGMITEAEPRVREIIERNPTDEMAEQVYEALAKGYLASFQLRKAWDCLEHWVRWQPDNLTARLLRGELCERNGEAALAVKEYEAILARRPNHVAARLRLGQSLLHTSSVEAAQQAFEACLEVAPQEPLARLGLAECFQRLGDLDRATTAVDQALQCDLSDTQSAQAWLLKGRVLMVQGQRREAVEALQEVLRFSPVNADAHHDLSRAYTLLGESELGEQHRAVALMLSGQNTRIKELTSRLINDSSNVDLRCELGALLAQQGHLVEAEHWFKNALFIDPGHPRARRELAGLERMLAEVTTGAGLPATETATTRDE